MIPLTQLPHGKLQVTWTRIGKDMGPERRFNKLPYTLNPFEPESLAQGILTMGNCCVPAKRIYWGYIGILSGLYMRLYWGYMGAICGIILDYIGVIYSCQENCETQLSTV